MTGRVEVFLDLVLFGGGVMVSPWMGEEMVSSVIIPLAALGLPSTNFVGPFQAVKVLAYSSSKVWSRRRCR